MTKTVKSICLIFITAVISYSANAAYVSERLYLGVYAIPDTTGTPVKMLPSGEQVEVLETEGDFTKIRSKDKSEGWVRTEFITEVVPTKVKLKQVTSQRDQLQLQLNSIGITRAKVKELQSKLAQSEKTITQLQGQLQGEQSAAAELVSQQQDTQQQEIVGLQEQLQKLSSTITSLETAKQELEDKLKSSAHRGPYNPTTKIAWLIVAMTVSLILGGWLGVQWLEKKIRKKFNGLRVW